MKFDAEYFNGKCPYTDKLCNEWECVTCEINKREKDNMDAMDRAEYKEWIKKGE